MREYIKENWEIVVSIVVSVFILTLIAMGYGWLLLSLFGVFFIFVTVFAIVLTVILIITGEWEL